MKQSSKQLPLKKNDNIRLEITAFSALGTGIGRFHGFTVFVDGAMPGDVIEAHIIKLKTTYAVGIINRVLKPSKDRIAPDCAVSDRCGGCSFRALSYGAELRYKKQKVQDALQRIGGMELEVKEILSTGETAGYRNKAQYPVSLATDGRTLIGFYAKKSHRVIDCRNCALQPPEFELLLTVIARWAAEYGISVYDETAQKGLLRHIYLRKGFATGETMVCLVVSREQLPHAEQLIGALLEADRSVCSVVLNVNPDKTNVVLGRTCRTLFGKDAIEDVLCGLRFQISPLSFYQVNPKGCELLYKQAADFAALTGAETVLDLYCGTGTIGLSMAHRAKQIIGVEVIDAAIENAKDNAARNGIENARFFCDDASGAAKRLQQEGLRPDVVVLDPPRKGCAPDVIDAVAAMAPDRVVYVSCDPATLARDCKRFSEMGYRAEEAVAVDMFPRTVHVETVVQLSKGNISSEKIRVEFNLEDIDTRENVITECTEVDERV